MDKWMGVLLDEEAAGPDHHFRGLTATPSNRTSNQDLDRLFRLKRLDLALPRDFLFLTYTSQTIAFKNVSDLHT